MPVKSGELRERLAFDKRADLSTLSPPGDGLGNFDGDWEEQLAVFARIKPLKGSEQVLAARLTGIQPYVITIRYSKQSSAITPGWRARNVRNGDQYNITAIADMDEQLQSLDILATRGEAIG